ncbi:PDZ and LIM domain protein 5 isoform X2 [Prionailurus viverrinus]|uniref:PDZ and LIM domain protein 5 isoform X11 n=1 Tax=Acinonyx jubatus TaxID=32536 RepID=A0A6J1ZH62_ACIJB|nr:PDZ and LIM domain protein 5 isoform X12 [Felis catus]XP_026916731.1 PDZ and LIM domain protein 5 isoform X11 [Acinonyx jubatus]XP_040334140.1 PDZ and LIM domain protein 5 isoform X3 [Puma yagouaroundi]XP_042840094.1 PDZ and LIM domain protein 5 isoform X2 [Panthera tigris]XP_045328579.1 PDZ and LIM domain protein 5 isoform X14 [Leopardus geoffroyi]XP_045328584.1 PDZ and LIM domain protein 5 isoform X14 [Leopardus geoffroyi]XP_047711488.1 PDZ and LIM domain protein 5 isoform X2 [Prionailur
MSNYSVSLVGPAPWGFRLQGGKDFNMPLTISNLKDGGKASQANVRIGDVVLTIDGISAHGMTHLEAQNKIKGCTGSLNMTLQRASATPKPEPVPVQKGEPKEVVKPVPIPSPAVSKVTSTTNTAYNKAPRPFGSVSSPKVTSIPSPSSAFTPPHATTSSHASPPPVAAVTPPSFAASGLHANANLSADQHSSALSAGKPAVNVPRQPTVTSVCSETAQELAEGQRRGSQGDSKQQNGPPRKHIVERNTEFYHIPTHSDASKKRLMEDTEDWRPRTGTTQSRSFRILAQITGTEHLKESETENTKKANNTQETPQQLVPSVASARSMPERQESPAATRPGVAGLTTAAAFKPPGSTNVIKSPSWQQPNQAALSSGRISNSAASSGAVAPANSARGQPQSHDQGTLVQRAEHIPAGKRTPMCAHCNQVIRGPFLVALGKSWHPEEFNCAHCKNTMAYIGFVEEKGSLYCELCYEKFFAPECGRCQRKILGEVINALKQTWHVSCFVCVACGKPIRNNVFHLEDGEPYCETDYYALFGTICRGCEFPIEAGDMFLEALGFTWHDTCFVCSVCCESLEGQTFFSKKDKPLCKKHAHSVNF